MTGSHVVGQPVNLYATALMAAYSWSEGQVHFEAPLIAHLVSTGGMAARCGADEDVAIAAFLHHSMGDADPEVDLRCVAQLFGVSVCELVAKVGKNDTPLERLEPADRYQRITALHQSGAGVQLIAACSRLDDLRSYARQPELCKDQVWELYRDLLGLNAIPEIPMGGAYVSVMGDPNSRWIYDEILRLFLEIEWDLNYEAAAVAAG